jgi:hypothetical protein
MPENYICPICHKLPLGCTCWILGGSQKPGAITEQEPLSDETMEDRARAYLKRAHTNLDGLAQDVDLSKVSLDNIIRSKGLQDIANAMATAGSINEPGGIPKEAWENLDPNKEDLGKYMAGVLADFAPALQEVAKLGSMNNKPGGKYERGSWMLVQDPLVKYNDAFWRHLLDGPQNLDPTTGMHHDVAVAWNALALVWFRLQKEKDNANSNV